MNTRITVVFFLFLSILLAVPSFSWAEDFGNSETVASTAQEASSKSSFDTWTVIERLYKSTGIYQFIYRKVGDPEPASMLIPQVVEDYPTASGWMKLVMIAVGCLLLYLAIVKKFEPLLLLPIGFGTILTNIPMGGIAQEGGLLKYFFDIGIATEVCPLLIFLGIGALTDFGPLIANPKTALLGAAAQIGVFGALIGALLLTKYAGFNFSLQDACSIGIIGGADGPTSIFLSSQLSPNLMGAIAVAAYSYMALVPLIQPPIMRLLTNEKERMVVMEQLRPVSRAEKIIFPLIILFSCILLLPTAAPLMGLLAFGNLLRESGVVERLSKTAQNEMINLVTIVLGLGVSTKLSAERFLRVETLGIIVLGLVAFALSTAGGVIFGKIMCKFTGGKVNPLIGAAGVSAVPMAARVAAVEGQRANPTNYLLMHAMGPNVAGVIGTAIAAGVLLAVFK
ncbi:MAG: Glutaconyl-CoA decarboxylase subunit beta [bacterium ADurb.Bin270]|nr:sodium ion-translocating decarboxylase subunit beta [Myxococcales bacterium]OQA60211.1 MAG: Glutaconyl-CoA decarboxylase subunit beta [bacterium ADurb.Bin270]